LFKTLKLPASEVGSLKVYGRTLLDLKIEDSESPRTIVYRLPTEVGLQVPDNFDFSEVEKHAGK
jgi:hypothetical protein